MAAEQYRESERFLEAASLRLRDQGAGNLEWLELGLRAALMADAAAILEKLLNAPRHTGWCGRRVTHIGTGEMPLKNIGEIFILHPSES